MKRILLIAGIITLLSILVSNAFSATITYTYTGHGSGNLDGVSFLNENFTISATGDTAMRENVGNDVFLLIILPLPLIF